MSIIETHTALKPRIAFFYAIIGVTVTVLFCGLAYRQLLSQDAFLDSERRQSQRRILIPGPRGEIFDRENRVLVANRPTFATVLYFSDENLQHEFQDSDRTLVRDVREGILPAPPNNEFRTAARARVVQKYLDQCNAITGRHDELSWRTLKRHYNEYPLLPFPLLKDLTPSEFAECLEQLLPDSPIQLYSSTTRHYPYGSAAAHTLGYVTSTQDLPAENLPGADLHTFYGRGSIGRDGLEREFDDQLQGKTGSEIWVVDPSGFQERMVENTPPVPGNSIYTSLDVDLQLAGERAFAEREGALVALDVKTGEILALVSQPDYDLNDLTPYISFETKAQIDDRGAWLNRAIQGTYPPGSTFKLITAMAALRNGAITPDTVFDCPGSIVVGNRTFRCHAWRRGGHGKVDLVRAITVSCNVFFYKTALALGPEKLAAEARRFGYDQVTSVELPNEVQRMIVPDPEWKRNSGRGGWVDGDTANFAIGQGFLDVTPLQVACFTASLARGETRTVPTILRRDNRTPRAAANNQSIGLPPQDMAAILQGMEQCAQFGTAQFANIPGIRLGGKTGTAQKLTPRGMLELAWTLIFGPLEDPHVAVAVIIVGEKPDEPNAGGREAGPVAKQVLEAYFQKHPVAPAPSNASAPTR